MRKIIALFLAIIIALTLAACGGEVAESLGDVAEPLVGDDGNRPEEEAAEKITDETPGGLPTAPTDEPEPEPEPELEPTPTPEFTPEPAPEFTPEPAPEFTPEPIHEPIAKIKPIIKTKPERIQTPTPTPTPELTSETESETEPSITPTPSLTPSQSPSPTPSRTPARTPQPTNPPTATPVPTAAPIPLSSPRHGVSAAAINNDGHIRQEYVQGTVYLSRDHSIYARFNADNDYFLKTTTALGQANGRLPRYIIEVDRNGNRRYWSASEMERF
jgi:hypothetical protein